MEDYLKHHLPESITIVKLAKIAHCSVRSLQNTFVAIRGLTPMQFVRRKRLAAAHMLLKAGSRSTNVSNVLRVSGIVPT
jgi:transcriptional regulator GlxA family with amidase domain